MKFSPSHSSYIEAAVPILKILKHDENVSKISLGVIKVKYPRAKTAGKSKIQILKSHLHIVVNSKSAVQHIRVYGKNLDVISEKLKGL